MASMVVVAGKTVTIDLNGKKLTVDANKMNGTNLYAVFAADNGGSLTLTDSVGDGSVSATGTGFQSGVTAYCLMMAYEDGTKLTVKGGSYYMEAAHDSLIYAGGGTHIVKIEDGYFELGNVGYKPVTGNNGKPWLFNSYGANENCGVYITGGTFNADIDDKNYQHWHLELEIIEGKHCVDNGDGTWTVKAYVPVAQNTTTNKIYATLADAIAAAKNGETITMIANHTMDGATVVKDTTELKYDHLIIVDGKTLTIDFNGYTVEVTPEFISDGTDGGLANALESVIFLANGADLTLKDSTNTDGGFKVNAGTALYSLVYVADGTKLTVENGEYVVEELVTSGALIYGDAGNTIVINGGKFTLGNAANDSDSTKPWIFNVLGKNVNPNHFIVVNGGTFNQNILMNAGSAKDCEVKLAEGYCLYLYEGNGTWTVVDYHTAVEIIPAVKPTIDAPGSTEGKKCSVCGKILEAPQEIPVLGKVARIGDTYYATVAQALAAAQIGDNKTVTLVADATEATLLVPVGVTLNLNGCNITAGNVISFGYIIDNNGTTDGNGGIVISNDRTQAFVQLQSNNTYLPIYDTYKQCYRFFEYQFESAGAKLEGTNTVKYGVALKFTNVEAFDLLAKTNDSGLTFSIQLTWNGGAAPMVFTFAADTVKTFAKNAYEKYSDPDYTGTRVLTLKVNGLDSLDDGVALYATPILESATGVRTTDDPISSDSSN
jgi:hypothetical protein